MRAKIQVSEIAALLPVTIVNIRNIDQTLYNIVRIFSWLDWMVAEKMAPLLPVGAEERFVEAKRVWDRIEAISAETAEFIRAMDNLDNTSNCSSVLSDPFSDMGESEFVKARSNKVRRSEHWSTECLIWVGQSLIDLYCSVSVN